MILDTLSTTLNGAAIPTTTAGRKNQRRLVGWLVVILGPAVLLQKRPVAPVVLAFNHLRSGLAFCSRRNLLVCLVAQAVALILEPQPSFMIHGAQHRTLVG